MREHKIDICLVQETHSVESNYRYWRSEWGGELYCSHGSSSSAGVAILIQKNLPVTVTSELSDEQRHFLCLKISYLHKSFFLANFYAPSENV